MYETGWQSQSSYWKQQQEPRRKEIPFILDEKLWPSYDGLRDELIELYNDHSEAARMKWREVLNTPANSMILDKEIIVALKAGKNLVICNNGGKGTGKSLASIAIGLRLQDLMKRICNIDAEIVFTQTYTETNAAVQNAEKKHKVLIVIQDEDPILTGADKVNSRNDFFNNIDELRYRRHCFLINGIKYSEDFNERMDFRIVYIGFNEAIATSLGIIYNKFNRPRGWVTIMKQVNQPKIYEEYTLFKEALAHKTASEGGSLSGVNKNKVMDKVDRILEQTKLMYPDQPEIDEADIYDAAVEINIALPTTPGILKPIIRRVKKGFLASAQGNAKPTPKEEFLPKKSDHQSKARRYATQDAKSKARAIYQKSKEWEQEFKEIYAPKLFESYTDLASVGEIDGIGVEKGDHTEVIVALENGVYQDKHSTTIFMGVKNGKEGGRIYKEIVYARMQKKLGKNVKMVLFFKEESRNKVYPIPIDIEKPRSHTINFDKDPTI